MRLFLLVSFISLVSNAQTILTCKEEKSAIISWQEKSLFKKAGLVAETNETADGTVLTLVIDKNRITLKGNADQVELKKIKENVFLEESNSGNIFLWTLLEDNRESSKLVYLIQQKAYNMMGVFSITVAYKCK